MEDEYRHAELRNSNECKIQLLRSIDNKLEFIAYGIHVLCVIGFYIAYT